MTDKTKEPPGVPPPPSKPPEKRVGNVFEMFSGAGKKDAFKELRRILESFLHETTDLERSMEIMAKLRKMKYDALVKQGFTAEQAIEIVKSAGITDIF